MRCHETIAKLYQRVTSVFTFASATDSAVTPAKRAKLATFTILQADPIVLSVGHTPPGPLAEFSK
jgi:hypothetical protein